MNASSLADLFNEAEPTPRLVVLNSCMSGMGGTTELFSGTAAALVRSGIHAVAAMQFTISDVAALAFARGRAARPGAVSRRAICTLAPRSDATAMLVRYALPTSPLKRRLEEAAVRRPARQLRCPT